MFCPECGEELVRTTAPLMQSYKGEEFVVEGIQREECPSCGEFIISAGESERLESALQAKVKAAAPR